MPSFRSGRVAEILAERPGLQRVTVVLDPDLEDGSPGDDGPARAYVLTELIGDVATESDRLDRMLTNMLSLAAIMAGRLSPDTEPVLMRQFVRKVSAEAARIAPDYSFEIDLAPDLPPAEADVDLLGQVMRNLYENAVKYSPDGRTIRTTVVERNGCIVLSVQDEGFGIASQHVGSVFERFRRPGADPTVRGMGLGLYLSRHLVEVQGGRIWAESPGVGFGATFSIELPIARE